MIYYKCLYCGAVFSELDAEKRHAELEDSLYPWEDVRLCPDCFSDETIEYDPEDPEEEEEE